MFRLTKVTDVGRQCFSQGRRANSAGRQKSSGPGSSGYKVAAAGVLIVAAGGGIAYAAGNLPFIKNDNNFTKNNPLKSFKSTIPVVAANQSLVSPGSSDPPVKLKRKKKPDLDPSSEANTSSAAVTETIHDNISVAVSLEVPIEEAEAVVEVASEDAETAPEPVVVFEPEAVTEPETVGDSTDVTVTETISEPVAQLPDAIVEEIKEAIIEEFNEAPSGQIPYEAVNDNFQKVVAEISQEHFCTDPPFDSPFESHMEYLLDVDTIQKLKELDLEEEAENKALTSILTEALQESTKSVSEAVIMLVDASDSVKQYTLFLKKALDDAHPDQKKGAWESAVGMSLEKDKLLTAASQAYQDAKNAMIIALQAVEGGRQGPKTRDNPELLRVEEKIYRLRSELDDRFLAFEKVQSDARIMKAFTDLVEQGKQQFNAELKALMPDIKLNETGSKLSEAELNLLIAYAHRWIMQLQRQLAEYQFLEEQHLTEALEGQKKEDQAIAEAQLREALADQHSTLNMERERQIVDVRRQAEADLLAQLKRQAAAHSQHLREVLAIQEEEYNSRLKLVLTEGIAGERSKLEEIVRESFSQLKGIEAAIESRAAAEAAARARQDLWVAVSALKAAIGDENRIPLSARAAAVAAACKEDSFISTLLSAIPQQALDDGVYSFGQLKAKFEKVREICKKVSLVTEDGGLFQTIVSYLNYKITNESVYIAPVDEVNPETDSMLKLVCHAQWYVEHGDFESALRCMNQLRGEPRRTAFDWISEARVALETKQAVDALHSWVSALNVGQFPPELKS